MNSEAKILPGPSGPASRQEPLTYAIGAHENVLLAVCVDEVNAASLQGLRGWVEDLAQKSPGGVGLAVALPPGAPLLMSKRDRDLATELLKTPGLEAFALVLESEGFWAATARSILVGMTGLSRRRVPVKVVSSVEEAASWFAERFHRPAPALSEALRAARDRAMPRFR